MSLTKEPHMTARFVSVLLALAALGLLLAPSRVALADDNPANKNPHNKTPEQQAAVAKSAYDSKVSLQDGLAQAGSQGQPISGKFDNRNGKVMMSIYTATDNGYQETVVDPDTGRVLKTQKITDPGDLNDAQAQNTAMGQASEPLEDATDDAVQANDGFVAVSVYPQMKDGHPVAEITLVRDGATKTVTQQLD
jgi:hypothetical protein